MYAANVLQEMMTIKSDDVVGRVKVYESIVKGSPIPNPGIPEAFRVLIKEFQALGLDISVINNNDEVVGFKELEMSEEDDDDVPTIEEVTNDKKIINTDEILDENDDLEDEFEDVEEEEEDFTDLDEEEMLEEIDEDLTDEEIGGEF